MAVNVMDVFVNIQADTKGFQSGLESVKSEASNAGNESGSNLMNALSSTVKKLLGTLAIGATIKQSITSALDFQDSIAKVSTLVDTSKHSVSELSKTFEDLSNKTGKSASELAEAGYQALSASVDYDNLGSFVETATNLAKVGFTDASTSVDILTTAINAYGDSAGTAEQIANKLVLTQNLGKTTVAELGASMGRVIPTANAFGVNIDNLTSSYVSLTKQGVNTHIATSQLNAMFNELGDTGSDLGKIIQEKTGKSFKECMESGMSLREVLQITSDYAKETGVQFSDLWSNTNSMKAGLALLNTSAEEFDYTLDQMANNTSVLGEGLDKLLTPQAMVNKSINIMKNSLMDLGTSIVGAVTPAIKGFYEMMNNLVDGMSFEDALGPFIGSIRAVFSNIVLWIKYEGISMLNEAWFSMLDILSGDTVSSFIEYGASLISSLSSGFVQGIPNLLAQTLPMSLQFVQSLRSNFGTIVDAGIEILQNLVQGVANALPILIEYIPQIIIEIAGLVNDNGPKILEAGFNMLLTLAQGIINAIPDLIAQIPKIFEAFIAVWSALNWVNLGQNVINWIKNGINSLASNIPNAIKSIGNTAKEWFKNIDWVGVGKTIINALKNGISGVGSLIWNALKSIGQSAMNIFNNIDWGSLGTNLVKGIWNGISNVTGWIINKIGGFTSSVLKSIKGFFGIHSPSTETAWVGKMLMEGMAEGIDDNASNVLDSMSSMGEDLMKEAESLSVNPSISAVASGDVESMGSSNNGTVGAITMNIYANDNMNVNELADVVAERINKVIKRGGSFA